MNEQVNRNIDRFPEDFMFRLNEEKFQHLRSQFATSSWGGRRALPYVFIEQGVLMLSSVLSSKQAIQVNIQVMRIFTRILQMLADNMEIVSKYLDELLEKQDHPNPPRKRIGFKPDDL